MSKEFEKEKNIDVKQAFLSNAIGDISSYIQLVDTKVSIIMAAVVAIFVGAATCNDPISEAIKKIQPCSWIGVFFMIISILCLISIILVFLFGLLTVRGHSSTIKYKSKWFIAQSAKEYSFNDYSKDIQKMTDEDIIINMAAELYKLNDINRQKLKSFKWTLISFTAFLISLAFIVVVIIINLI